MTIHQLNGVAKRVCYPHLWLRRLLQIIDVSSRWNQSRLKAWNWTVYVCHCFALSRVFFNILLSRFYFVYHAALPHHHRAKGAAWWPAVQGREILVTQRARGCYAWPRSPLNSQCESSSNGHTIAISSAIPGLWSAPRLFLCSRETKALGIVPYQLLSISGICAIENHLQRWP